MNDIIKESGCLRVMKQPFFFLGTGIIVNHYKNLKFDVSIGPAFDIEQVIH